jgi:hypothetical protein
MDDDVNTKPLHEGTVAQALRAFRLASTAILIASLTSESPPMGDAT